MKKNNPFSPTFCRSFGCALCGIVFALTRERNLRIHLTAGAFVLYLSRFYALSRAEFGLLVLCMGLVIAAELMNTAIEYTIDLISPEYNALAGIAKDVAAGAVLAAATASVVVGVLLFWDIPTLTQIAGHILQRPLLWLGLAAAALFWIALPIRPREE